MHPAAQVVQHFPARGPQLVLHPDRKIPAPLLQHVIVDDILLRLGDRPVTRVVPGLEIIEQLIAQQIAPWPVRARPGRPMRSPLQAAPLLVGGGLPLFLRVHQPDAASAVIPFDECPVRLCHTARLPTATRYARARLIPGEPIVR